LKLTSVAFLLLHSRVIAGVCTSGRQSTFSLARGTFPMAGQAVASKLTLVRVAVKATPGQAETVCETSPRV